MVLLELGEAEEVAGNGEDGGVELPAMHGEVRVEVEERPGRGAGTEAENGEGGAREEWWERGESVEVGSCERAVVGAAREREGVDVARAVEEEEAGAGQRVARGARGDVGDADVVVRGTDLRDELELVGEGLDTWASCCGASGGGAAGTEDWAVTEWTWHPQHHRRHGDFRFPLYPDGILFTISWVRIRAPVMDRVGNGQGR